MVAGICAGIAEYADVDPTIIRAIWAVITFFSGIVGGCVLYLILCFVMPVNKGDNAPNNHPGTYGGNGAVTH